MNITGPEQVQKLEHAKKLLQVRLHLIHKEQQSLLDEQNKVWLEMRKVDNELAAAINTHTVCS